MPELGEENIQEMSFDIFAYKELLDVVSDCEDRNHYIEDQIQGVKTEYGEWKQSEAFIGAMEVFLLGLEDRLVDFRNVSYKGFTKKEEDILNLFYYKFPETPLLDRMEAIMDLFVDEYETLYNRTLQEDELEKLREKFIGELRWFTDIVDTLRVEDTIYKKEANE